MHLNCFHWIVSTKKRILVIGSQCVNEKSWDFAYNYESLFPTQLPSYWSMNMVRELPLRLNQCFGPFTMLPVDRWSKTGLFRHLPDHVFRGPWFRKYINSEGHLSLKMFKIWCKFEKWTKKFRKNFLFLRQMHLNCLHWIVSTKKRILVIGSQCVNEKSWDFAYNYESLFPTQLPSYWSMNMVRELPLRLNQCFRPCTMLPVDGSSQTGLFRYLSNHVFRGP